MLIFQQAVPTKAIFARICGIQSFWLKYDVKGSYSPKASHGDPETTTEDVVFVSWSQICFKWQQCFFQIFA